MFGENVQDDVGDEGDNPNIKGVDDNKKNADFEKQKNQNVPFISENNMKFNWGQVCLIIGKTASGKTTTLLQMLEKRPEFFPPDIKKIFYTNGINSIRRKPGETRQKNIFVDIEDHIPNFDWITVDDLFNQIENDELESHCIIVLDDFADKLKNPEVSLLVKGNTNHRDLLVFVIVQNLFTPELKVYRENSAWIGLTGNMNDKNQLISFFNKVQNVDHVGAKIEFNTYEYFSSIDKHNLFFVSLNDLPKDYLPNFNYNGNSNTYYRAYQGTITKLEQQVGGGEESGTETIRF